MPRALIALVATLLTAAGPAPVAEPTVTLAPDAEARWVPFDLTPGNQIRFSATVDGRAVKALLDTGASYSVMARASADPARITAGGSATAVGGSVSYGWLPTATVSFGGLTRRGGRIGVADLPAAATALSAATNIDVLIGRDMIGDQALDIDFANRRFRVLPSGRLPFAGVTAPLVISPGRRVYESAIAIGDQRIAPVIVDTGDGAAITIANQAWNVAGLTERVRTTTTVAFGLAGEVVSTLAIAPAVTIGQLTARDVELKVEPSGGFSQTMGVWGRIGSGFLQRYRVLLDPGAGRMVLQPIAGSEQPPLRSTSGLLTGVLPDRLRILHVMRGSPAEAAGWRSGEEICAVDGAAIDAGYVGSTLSRWSVGAPGRVVALKTCAGAVRPLTLASFY